MHGVFEIGGFLGLSYCRVGIGAVWVVIPRSQGRDYGRVVVLVNAAEILTFA